MPIDQRRGDRFLEVFFVARAAFFDDFFDVFFVALAAFVDDFLCAFFFAAFLGALPPDSAASAFSSDKASSVLIGSRVPSGD